jgi:hypothetical protein
VTFSSAFRIGGGSRHGRHEPEAQGVKISDPTSVVMIVNRD